MEERRRRFPAFVIWLLVFMLSLLALITRCSASLFAKEPPSITVTAEGVQLSWAAAKKTWNGAVYGQEDIFCSYGEDIALPSQAAAGETVSVTIEGTPPDRVSLLEYALGADRRSVYGSATLLKERTFYFDGRTGTFTLPEPEEYPVRGYLLRCSWGENCCEYGLVIQILPE